MKKILMILLVATVLVSCGSSSSEEVANNDSTTVSLDTNGVSEITTNLTTDSATTLTDADSSATK